MSPPSISIKEGVTVNTKGYLDLLESKAIPWMEKIYGLENVVFRQDGAIAHTSKRTQNFLRERVECIEASEWPPSILTSMYSTSTGGLRSRRSQMPPPTAMWATSKRLSRRSGRRSQKRTSRRHVASSGVACKPALPPKGTSSNKRDLEAFPMPTLKISSKFDLFHVDKFTQNGENLFKLSMHIILLKIISESCTNLVEMKVNTKCVLHEQTIHH